MAVLFVTQSKETQITIKYIPWYRKTVCFKAQWTQTIKSKYDIWNIHKSKIYSNRLIHLIDIN